MTLSQPASKTTPLLLGLCPVLPIEQGNPHNDRTLGKWQDVTSKCESRRHCSFCLALSDPGLSEKLALRHEEAKQPSGEVRVARS